MMPWATERISRNSTKVADGGVYVTLSTPVAQNCCIIISKIHEVAATTLNGSQHRYNTLTFVKIVLDEHCKVVAPFLIPLSWSVWVDLEEIQRNYLLVGPVRSRITQKVQSRLNKPCTFSLQKVSDSLAVSSDLSDTSSSSTSDSSIQTKDTSEVAKHTRNSRKKPNKKGKHNQKSSESVSSISTVDGGDPLGDFDASQFSADHLITKSSNIKERLLKDTVVEGSDKNNVKPFQTEASSSRRENISQTEEESFISIVREAGSHYHARSVKTIHDATFSSRAVDMKISHADVSVENFTMGHDAFLMEPLDGSKSNMNIRIFREEECATCSLGSGMVSEGSNYSTLPILPVGVGCAIQEKSYEPCENFSASPEVCMKDFTYHSDRIRLSNGKCNNITEKEFIPSRKATRATQPNKSAEKSSGIAHRINSCATGHARTGKENSHSIWQKVSRTIKNGGVNDSKGINNVQLPPDAPCNSSSPCTKNELGNRRSRQGRSGKDASQQEMSAQEYPQKTISDAVDVLVLKEEDALKRTTSEKLGMKSNAELKPEITCQLKKSFSNKKGLSSRKKTFNDSATKVSWEAIQQSGFTSNPAYSHYVRCPRLDALKADKNDFCNSFIKQDLQMCLPAQCPPAETSQSTDQILECEVKSNSSTITSNSLTSSLLLAPVGAHNEQAMTGKISLYIIDKSNLQLEDGNFCEEQDRVSYRSDHVPPTHPCFENLGNSKPSHISCDDLQLHDKSIDHAPSLKKTVDASTLAATNNTSHPQNEERSITEDAVDKIVEAVRDAYRIQIESEDIQLATGSHLAGFERVLDAAAPMFPSASNAFDCGCCLCNKQAGNVRCEHQIPNHSLATVWKWYEEPGCYGLKVKILDFERPRRSGADLHESCAYFLPLLSAVQLFGHSVGSLSSNTEVTEIHKAKTSSSLTKFWSLPILSILLPKPLKVADDDDGLVHTRLPSRAESFASRSCEVHSVSSGNISPCTTSEGPQLLFEYFEAEKPQQRKPLFEKIKELVKGDTLASSQIYGDPAHLMNLSLCDLHPASWFSVAWYPIYRIPEDSFRTTFLTYHSLGHFTNSCCTSYSPTEMKSPVVGLQHYNDQGEGWFSLRNSMLLGHNHPSDPSILLEKRLRTLEKTASMMSRACIRREDGVTMNRHPDYEFFLCRRW